MSTPTIKEIKDATDMVEVIGRYVNLKKDGIHWKGKCPFHTEKTGSLTVTPSKQLWKCFGCGEGGDVLEFLVRTGKSFKDALAELTDPSNTSAIVHGEKNKSSKKQTIIEWKPILPGKMFVAPDFTHYTLGQPVKTWAYKTIDGETLGFICRFELPDGKKTARPLCYAENGDKKEWRWMGFNKPYPLYNLDQVANDVNKTIIISEGEKTADAVAHLVQTAISVTWMFGAASTKNTDFSPLYGRKIILWPDNDIPGLQAMFEIAQILKPHCPIIRWVKNPSDVPEHWDAADAEWTPEFGRKFVLENLVDVPEEIIIPEQDLQPIGPIHEPPPYVPPEHQEPPPGQEDIYFKILGYEKDNHTLLYHFYSYNSKAVISFAPTQMGKSNLMQLAPLNWWEGQFPAKSGFNVDAAQDFLIRKSIERRVFNEKWIRGRGAWIDKHRTVVHTGDQLIVNGHIVPLNKHQSRYIYEIGEELGFSTHNPLTTKEAYKFIDVCKLLNWEREINSFLFAGWCIIAPICGALTWRPHIWLTGAAGTGKSWVFEKIVRLMLGQTCLAVQGESSEAGLRQTLKHDALPVVFDEAEGNDRKNQDRMQNVIALMRSASTADGGNIVKGTAGGHSQTFKIRSCFAFASIGVQIVNQSDITRVTVLSIKKEPNEITAANNWKKLQELYNHTITEAYAERMRARTIALLPIILKNTKTFANAVASVLGEQRAGDQIGALLAGAYSLRSINEVTFDEAIEFVKSKNWDEEKGHEKTKDEIALIAYLMEQLTRIETSRGPYERTIGELIQVVHGLLIDEIVTVDICRDRLLRIGIKVETNHIVISNSANEIKKYLRETTWARNHNKILMRVEKAEAVELVRFASGVLTRAVKIPITVIFKDLGKI